MIIDPTAYEVAFLYLLSAKYYKEKQTNKGDLHRETAHELEYPLKFSGMTVGAWSCVWDHIGVIV
ncbi:hypothetical protein AMP2_gp049 [Pseudomonas phage vB_Pae_AM.P2]|uniref:Uncharacterized protein n=1 Tax=Pseudomonas phage vB_Pae_AM.P2 TaxID=2731695 RepID=A0A7S5W9X2_9CAUD|nr:hypothetical protein AMP2_gp049 [Pseudomonas phage vB_Pae_AM.P2]